MTVDEFTTAYLICALWSSADGHDEPLDRNYGLHDLSEELLNTAKEDCRRFQETHAGLLSQAYQTPGYTSSQAGHDFWLTRNGHGAGFWDRGLEEVGDQLTTACDQYAQVDLYVGDDGRIYG